MAGNIKHGFRRGNRSTLRPQIENTKCNIKSSTRPFDGDGYVFKQAVKELRQEGFKIEYVAEKCHYVKLAA